MTTKRSAGLIKALNEVDVITLFVDDPALPSSSCPHAFGLESVDRDDVSTVLKLGPVMINLLQGKEAPTLVEPANVAAAAEGMPASFTIKVEDADAVCAELERHVVRLLNGPVDRPWDRRTAAFADPSGHVGEIAEVLTHH